MPPSPRTRRLAGHSYIRVEAEMDEYAIVFFEALLPVTVIVFPARDLASVGAALRKRHPVQATTLQPTRRDHLRILEDTAEFAGLGVRVYRSPDWLHQGLRRHVPVKLAHDLREDWAASGGDDHEDVIMESVIAHPRVEEHGAR